MLKVNFGPPKFKVADFEIQWYLKYKSTMSASGFM